MASTKGHPPYNVNGEGGRPIEYTEEVFSQLADELIEWSNDPKNIFVEKFATNKRKSPPILQDWANKSARFAEALKYAKHVQEAKLKEGGLTRKYSDSFTKFLLINNHGVQKYAEKTETTISGDAANPFVMILNQTKELVQDEKDTDDGRSACY